MARDAEFWIESLGLVRHPEGGYFRETYRSRGSIPADALPEGYDGERSFSTAILFLLAGEDFSAFHRIRSDEIWHFHEGGPLTIHVIDPDGHYAARSLGSDVTAGQSLQVVVGGGCWFAAELELPRSHALVGCTVAPGFDFRDFVMAERGELIRRYPRHGAVITRLTRGGGAGEP